MGFVPRTARETRRPGASRLVHDETAIHRLGSPASVAKGSVSTDDDEPVPPEIAVDLHRGVLHDEDAGAAAVAADAERQAWTARGQRASNVDNPRAGGRAPARGARAVGRARGPHVADRLRCGGVDDDVRRRSYARDEVGDSR